MPCFRTSQNQESGRDFGLPTLDQQGFASLAPTPTPPTSALRLALRARCECKLLSAARLVHYVHVLSSMESNHLQYVQEDINE